jgi:heme-degrading monooxygenase HmoA
MAYSAVVDRQGDNAALLDRYDKVMPVVLGLGPQPGHIAHYCIETDSGIRIVNIFDTEDHLRAFFARPEFRKALEDGGVSWQDPVVWRVHSYRHF